MSAIDERIVSLKFDNRDFQSNIAATLASLQKLESSLKLDGAGKGIDSIGKAAGRFSLAGMASSVEGLAKRFSTLGIVGIAALTNLTNRAVNAGLAFTKSLTISPILDGYREYETKLNAIQTILANTGLKGAKGLKEVSGVLQELNTYSDKTIYNFGEMTRNLGTFTAAGVDLKTSAAAIKGISNLAAASGVSAEKAAGATYQISQALAAGKVNLQDLNSINQAGLGGKLFQQSIIETARVHGVAIDKLIKDEGSFRGAVSKGFLSSDILLESLNKFTGDLSAAQLKQMGYTKQQIKAIQEVAKTANDSATKVKTFSQLMGTLQEAVGSGWATTFEILFGNFNEAKTLFTNINNVLGGYIQTTSKARNQMLQEFKDLGGRKAVIDGLSNAFKAFVSVVTPIKEAFRDIFPATTGKQLADAAKTFRDFTAGLKIGAETADKVKRTFAGVFAVFDILKLAAEGAFKGLQQLFKGAGDGAGSFLSVTASIGDFIVGIRNALREGDAFARVFEAIGKALHKVLVGIGNFAGKIGGALDALDFGTAGKAFGDLVTGLRNVNAAGDHTVSTFDKLKAIFNAVAKFASSAGKVIGNAMTGIGDAIGKALGSDGFEGATRALNTGLLATIVLLVRGFLKSITSEIAKGGISGLLGKIRKSFDTLTDTLSAMQSTLRAATLLQIAAAIGIMTISMISLSKIDSAGLARAGAAISVMLGQLIAGLVIFQKFGTSGFIQMQTTVGLLIGLAVAVRILALSLKTLSSLNFDEIAKGLIGTAGLLTSLAIFTKLAAANKGGLISSAGLVLIAAAIKILASAVKDIGALDAGTIAKGLAGVSTILAAFSLFSKTVGNPITLFTAGAAMVRIAAGMKIMASAAKDFGSLSLGDLAKGLTGIAVSIGAVSIALGLLPRGAPISAVGIIIAAAALKIMADAVKSFAGLKLEEISKGLTAMSATLGAVGIAISLIPPTSVFSASALVIVATALKILSGALATLGGMEWEAISKGLVTLGGALGIIAGALFLMPGALPGAIALITIASAIRILTPALVALGGMSWESIAKGLVALAGAFAVIGVAGLLIAPVIPILLAFSGTIALLGAGVALFGAGVLLTGVGLSALAVGLTAVAAAATLSAGSMLGLINSLLDLLPKLGKALAGMLIEFGKIVAKSGPAIVEAITTVLLSFIQAIIKIIPQAVVAIVKLITSLVQGLVQAVPKIIQAGFQLMLALLEAIRDYIPKIIPVSAQIIVAFINGISQQLPKIVDAGVKLVISFINSVADAIDAHSGELGAAAGHLGVAIVQGIVKGIAGGIGQVTSAAANLAKSALNSAKGALGIHSPSKEFEKLGKFSVEGFVKGLTGDRAEVQQAFADIVEKTKAVMQSSAADVEKLEERLKRLTSARKKDKEAISETRDAIAQAKAENAAAGDTLTLLTSKTQNHRAELLRLSGSYDNVSKSLDAANGKLKEAIKLRDDYAAGVAGSYSALPDFAQKDVNVGEVGQELVDSNAALIKYHNTLDALRALGLSDTLYKELIQKGTAAQDFASQLLAAGKDQISVFNALTAQLQQSAKEFGDHAAKELYQGGVDAAQGLVNGFKSKKKDLEDAIQDIVDTLVNSVKKKLKIKSPSRVFAEIGGYSSAGLAQGLDEGAAQVAQSGENLGQAAILGLSKTIAGMAELVQNEINTDPTITPVLDLSGVRSSASDLEAMLAGQAVQIDGSYSAATDASRGYDANKSAATDPAATPGDTKFEFNQYNSSPKALSEVDIYRNTKNQISAAKGALGDV